METSGQMVALGVWLSGFVSPLDDTRVSWKGSCHPHHWLQVAEMSKPVINLVSLLQVGAPGAPFRHSHCLINASGCTLGSLTFYFAKVRWEKMTSWLFKFWFPSHEKAGKMCSARGFLLQSYGAWLWIDERSHWFGCQKCGVPKAQVMEDSIWKHGHALPPTKQRFQKPTMLTW